MTSKERRKQRRREEHQARKEANRRTPSAAAPLVPARSLLASEALDFDAPESERAAHPVRRPDFTERNRQNAQFSTGPKTPAGKAQSSINALRHGLAGNRFVLLDWEQQEDFFELLDNLRAEHQPATQTEALLVEKMAEHFWLSQRALRLQDMCFRMDLPLCDQPKELALYLRYGTTHDRAFHKCLAELMKLRAAQRKTEAEFVSQQLKQAAETRKKELHEAKLQTLRSKQPQRKTAALSGAPEEIPTQPFQPASNPQEHNTEIAMRAA